MHLFIPSLKEHNLFFDLSCYGLGLVKLSLWSCCQAMYTHKQLTVEPLKCWIEMSDYKFFKVTISFRLPILATDYIHMYMCTVRKDLHTVCVINAGPLFLLQ